MSRHQFRLTSKVQTVGFAQQHAMNAFLPVFWREIITQDVHEGDADRRSRSEPPLPGIGMCDSCPVHTKFKECQPDHPDCDWDGTENVTGVNAERVVKGPLKLISPSKYSREGAALYRRLMGERNAIREIHLAEGRKAGIQENYKKKSNEIKTLARQEAREYANR